LATAQRHRPAIFAPGDLSLARDADNASNINDVRAVKQGVASWKRAEL
jgi:hypothetical protein